MASSNTTHARRGVLRTAVPSDGYDLLWWDDAAKYLGPGVSVRLLKSLVYSGEIASVRVGGRRMIQRAELDRYIAANRRAAWDE